MRDTAFQIVSEAFAGKTDKAGKPYIEHLIRVAGYMGSDELKTIALLHDLLEDCPEWTEEKLDKIFSRRVVMSVVDLTRGKESYEAYIDRVIENPWARLVKMYDLIDNMDVTRLSELTDKDIERLRKYHKAYMRVKI